MDSTPIYDELQKTLIDPEGDDWDTSTPPEFASSIEATGDHVDDTPGGSQGGSQGAEDAGERSAGRSGGSRHRAED